MIQSILNKINLKIVATSILVLFAIINTNAQSKEKPNVLVIYTDDHRYTGVHELGGMPVKTPNLDGLAKEGIVFTNTYLMGAFSGATCMPSRAMLLSGRQLFTLKEQGHDIPKTHTTLGETFKKAGYYSHIVGKWHQDKQSLVRSFDSGDKIMGVGLYLVDHYRMPFWDWDTSGKFNKEDAYLLQYDKDKNITKRAITKNDKKGPIGTEDFGPHTSEVFAKHASEFIENYKKEEPFFMYVAFHAPHDPRQAPKKYRKKYKNKKVALTPSYMPQHPFDNGAMVIRDEALGPWPRTKEVAQEHLASYYSIITHLDVQIGKVIDALKESGKYDNTLIVFAGDSGLAVGNHGLLGKQSVYDEDGIHVPFVLSGGFIKNKGVRLSPYSYIHDIYPTVCDLAGIPVPSSVNGKSLVPVIDKKVSQVRDNTYHAYKQFQRAYRKGDYKLIEYVNNDDRHYKNGKYNAGSHVTQLFNFKKDPWETTNLSFLPEYKDLLSKMRKEMIEKAIELKDKEGNTLGQEYSFWDAYNYKK